MASMYFDTTLRVGAIAHPAAVVTATVTEQSCRWCGKPSERPWCSADHQYLYAQRETTWRRLP